MIQLQGAKTYGLVARNSTGYVEEAFGRLSSGQVIVPLQSSTDRHRIEVAGVEQVIEAHDGSGWMSPRLEMRDDDAVAQVLFTSGTEGEPKGVTLTHRNLADVVQRLNSTMRVTGEIREYVGVPVYHSFGFGRCRAVAVAGGQIYLPPNGFDPLELSRLLEAGSVNAISAVPSLWRVLLEAQVVSKSAGRRVRWIEIGSQYMSREEKLALRELFPEAKIVQHYGLTEASRTTFLEIDAESGERLESVGAATGNVEVDIGSDGRIRVRGPHVAREILRSGSRSDPRDEDGWLTTSDLGELRDGFLYYLGRADDVINCAGLKLPPDALERDMRESLRRPGDFAVCRVADPLRGDGILVVATPALQATDAELIDAALEAASSYNVNARGAIHVYRVESLPRTATGKVQRKELSRQYTESVGPAPAAKAEQPRSGEPRTIRNELGRILGLAQVNDQDTFSDLGGDSLRFIQASMMIQRVLGYLPPGWERSPIVELEALPRRSGNLVTVEASVLARTLGITSVVVNHSLILFGVLEIAGAAFMLFIPAGFSFARFQLQRILHDNRPWHALSTLPAIMVPTFLLTLAHQLKGGTLYPSVLLFYNNFIDHETDGGFNFWFIEVFIQMHVIFLVLCASSRFRNWMRQAPYTVSLILFAIGGVLSHTIPLVWNTEHIYNLVPHRIIWYFALGFCLFFANERWQRLLNTGLVILLSALQLPAISEALWVLVGGMLLAWRTAIRLPTLFAAALGAVASSSLYIYLTHPTLFKIAMVLPIPTWAQELMQLPIAIVGGVIVGLFVERSWSFGKRLLPARLRPA